jgi:dolichyl-phosphate-mannose-protein mannosyltransferase
MSLGKRKWEGLFDIWLVLVAGVLIRLLVYRFGTLALDTNTFLGWSDSLAREGFGNFYSSWSDYLPGYLYVLWFLGKIRESAGIDPVLLYKLPAMIADVLTGWIVYVAVRKLVGRKAAVGSAALYVLNPAVIANSSLWGQVDSLTALFSMLAIFWVERSLVLSAAALAIGTLIKPQAGFAAIVILYDFYRKKESLVRIGVYGLVGAAVFGLGFVPFASGKSLPLFILERIGASLGQYPYTSVNAFNFWALAGMWKSDTSGFVSARIVGYVLAGGMMALSALSLVKLKKVGEGMLRYLFASEIFLVSFLFLTRIHERHMLPVFAPMAVAAAAKPYLLAAYGGLSVVYLLNLLYAYVWITQDFREIIPSMFVDFLSLGAVAFLGWIFVGEGFGKRLKFGGKIGKEKRLFEKPEISRRAVIGFVFLALLFAAVTRFISLGDPAEEYFDEVYHAFTARIILHGDPKAWEWWNPHPEGFAYEWTHPPLAKEGMVLGMLGLGENALGWRAPAAILGVAAVFLVYRICRDLLGDDLVGIFAAWFFALDGLPLVMSRIGMNDMYFLTFMLLSFWLFIKDRTFLSSVFLGLAASSKWTVFWFLPLLAVAHFSLRKKIRLSYVWYFVIPPLVYIGSYLPMFLTGHDWSTFVGMQKQMWWYHTQLVATHPYTSSWWSWPFLLRPIWLYTSGGISNGFGKNMIANIYAMGNPFVFWTGIVAVIYVGYLAYVKRSRRLGLVVFSYLVFFAPWAFSPRIMFLYHYLPSLPFMAVAAGVMFREHRKLFWPFLLLATISFVYFYPHWIGMKVPLWLDESYYWFSSWR